MHSTTGKEYIYVYCIPIKAVRIGIKYENVQVYIHRRKISFKRMYEIALLFVYVQTHKLARTHSSTQTHTRTQCEREGEKHVSQVLHFLILNTVKRLNIWLFYIFFVHH